jgi:hypothetical protein
VQPDNARLGLYDVATPVLSHLVGGFGLFYGNEPHLFTPNIRGTDFLPRQ